MPLFTVMHADEAKSTVEEYLFGPTFQKIVSQFPRPLILRRHQGKAAITTVATSYPGTPDLRIAVNPFMGKFVVVKILYSVTGGNTFSVQYRIEAPVATENVGGTLTTTSASDVGDINSVDISALGGDDRRGMDGWLNIYLKVTGGTGTLKTLVVSQSEDVSSSHQFCLW